MINKNIITETIIMENFFLKRKNDFYLFLTTKYYWEKDEFLNF